MQNYLDQLAKLNELLAQQPTTVWGVLSFVVMLVLSLGATVAGMILAWKASPIDTLIRAGFNVKKRQAYCPTCYRVCTHICICGYFTTSRKHRGYS